MSDAYESQVKHLQNEINKLNAFIAEIEGYFSGKISSVEISTKIKKWRCNLDVQNILDKWANENPPRLSPAERLQPIFITKTITCEHTWIPASNLYMATQICSHCGAMK